jgi:hypothetical protein
MFAQSRSEARIPLRQATPPRIPPWNYKYVVKAMQLPNENPPRNTFLALPRSAISMMSSLFIFYTISLI